MPLATSTTPICPRLLRRTLPVLALAIAALVRSAGAQTACDPPPTYTNVATLTEGPFLVTLATERYEYLVGESVSFFLSFENISAAPATITNPSSISPLLGMIVVPDACTSLTEPCVQSNVFVSPEAVFFFGTPITVNPGQCVNIVRTWNPIDAAPGRYITFGGAQNGGGNESFEVHQPAGGIQLPILISSQPVLSISSTWSRVKALYR
jgi:hypothetical protein